MLPTRARRRRTADLGRAQQPLLMAGAMSVLVVAVMLLVGSGVAVPVDAVAFFSVLYVLIVAVAVVFLGDPTSYSDRLSPPWAVAARTLRIALATRSDLSALDRLNDGRRVRVRGAVLAPNDDGVMLVHDGNAVVRVPLRACRGGFDAVGPVERVAVGATVEVVGRLYKSSSPSHRAGGAYRRATSHLTLLDAELFIVG